MSSLDSSKSKTFAFSAIREGVSLFGRGLRRHKEGQQHLEKVTNLHHSHVALLQRPSNENLCAGLANFFGDLLQHRIVEPLTPHQWAVGLQDDIVLLAVLDDGSLLAPGMKLDLRQDESQRRALRDREYYQPD